MTMTNKAICPHCGQYINPAFERVLNRIQGQGSLDDRGAATTLPASPLTPLEQLQKLERLAKEFHGEDRWLAAKR